MVLSLTVKCLIPRRLMTFAASFGLSTNILKITASRWTSLSKSSSLLVKSVVKISIRNCTGAQTLNLQVNLTACKEWICILDSLRSNQMVPFCPTALASLSEKFSAPLWLEQDTTKSRCHPTDLIIYRKTLLKQLRINICNLNIKYWLGHGSTVRSMGKQAT